MRLFLALASSCFDFGFIYLKKYIYKFFVYKRLDTDIKKIDIRPFKDKLEKKEKVVKGGESAIIYLFD